MFSRFFSGWVESRVEIFKIRVNPTQLELLIIKKKNIYIYKFKIEKIKEILTFFLPLPAASLPHPLRQIFHFHFSKALKQKNAYAITLEPKPTPQ